jgi:hypothetical protein
MEQLLRNPRAARLPEKLIRERSAGEMKVYIILYSLPFILAIVGVVWWGFCLYRRSRNPLNEDLRPVLAEHGFDLISSFVPARYQTGPFPPPGYTVSHPLADAFTQDSWQFRRVMFRDTTGQEHEVWARLLFAGDSPEIEWIPTLEEIKREAEQTSRP